MHVFVTEVFDMESKQRGCLVSDDCTVLGFQRAKRESRSVNQDSFTTFSRHGSKPHHHYMSLYKPL
jgi:hypothetical protein